MATALIYTGFLVLLMKSSYLKGHILYSFYSSSIFKEFSFLFSIHLLHYISWIYMSNTQKLLLKAFNVKCKLFLVTISRI